MEHYRNDFVILTTQRTGSTFIAHLLDSHPSVVSYGEVFHPFGIGWGSRTQHTNTRGLLLLRNVLPGVFLTTQVFHAYPPNIAAVGFKFMYSQAMCFPSVLQYLVKRRTNVIFLNRRNLLESLVSLKRAQFSRVWTLQAAAERPLIHTYLDERECLGYFTETERMYRQLRDRFKKNPSIQIYYEDVWQNKKNGLDEVLRFLEVPKKQLSTPITKLREVALQDSVINYQELKKKFSQTKWASFFP
jgi:LPS sulfotransferase NodH